ncbi:hypothetical protein L2215_24535, partial [Xanthomonas perforans]|uniref:hypothetical protein n=1 Tax=Xanthomonas perforans TaxID=442694 RepID=UPI001F3141A6
HGQAEDEQNSEGDRNGQAHRNITKRQSEQHTTACRGQVRVNGRVWHRQPGNPRQTPGGWGRLAGADQALAPRPTGWLRRAASVRCRAPTLQGAAA